jgi:8-oxo-dGTP pyrophosphatase MutT (NUDIX family)
MGTPTNMPVITPAATVIVLRHAETVQVLMTQRHANLSFMGGMWVFPGGALSPSDASDAALGLLDQTESFSCGQMCDLQGQPLPRRECLALAIAACRETFEECGLLLAQNADGTPCDAELVVSLQPERAAIIKQPARFIELMNRERLRLDAASLLCWGHWITPSAVPRRFDTRFFVVAAPPDQIASTDSREATQHCWLSPAQLLAASERGEMSLPHPTLCNLLELEARLSAHGSIPALLQGERQRQLPPILPKVLEIDGQRTVVMPWDPEYQTSTGDGTPPIIVFPEELRALQSRALNARG